MNEFGDRIISADLREEDYDVENTLRPLRLTDYIGQEGVKSNLSIFMEAAKGRKESLDHVLLCGPPGLGKTTLSNIIAQEMGVQMKITSGPAIERAGDLAAILNGLAEGDILFIDEIHRLNRMIEEVLYPAMEDFAIDIVIGKGAGAKSLRLPLPHFTLIGATTRAGLLSAPLRDRFGMIHRLELYHKEELEQILFRSASVLQVEIEQAGAAEIAGRSRGTPRIANRLLKRVRDYAQVCHDGVITASVAREALEQLEIDKLGLDQLDRKILLSMVQKFHGGPVGLHTLAISIGEERDTVEDVYEPYLIQLGLLQRTSRGRMVTEEGYRYLGLPTGGGQGIF